MEEPIITIWETAIALWFGVSITVSMFWWNFAVFEAVKYTSWRFNLKEQIRVILAIGSTTVQLIGLIFFMVRYYWGEMLIECLLKNSLCP